MSAVLVVDVGGSHVKVLASGEQESRRADSGPDLTAAQMVEAAKELADDWTWDSVSVGIPSPVHGGRVVAEPVNLRDGWVGFDYEAAFGKPTKVVNDAAMQALGWSSGTSRTRKRRSRITPAAPAWRSEERNAGAETLQRSSPG